MSRNYSIQTFMYNEESQNRIHSDEVALQFGFQQAPVPGVVVFGHLTYLPMKSKGRSWLTDNQAEVRFLKPANHGQTIDCSYTESENRSDTKCFNPDCFNPDCFNPDRVLLDTSTMISWHRIL